MSRRVLFRLLSSGLLSSGLLFSGPALAGPVTQTTTPFELHLQGAPQAGKTLELVVNGPPQRVLLVRIERVALHEPAARKTIIAGTRPARPETLARVEARLREATSADEALFLYGRTNDAGRWSGRFTAPEAGTLLLVRGFEAAAAADPFEALELEIAPAPLASDPSVETLGTPGPTVAGSTPLPAGPPGRGTSPCATREDLPDESFADTNCDGIDGDRSRAVFVATSGAPSNPGTQAQPLDSIQDAILLAQLDPHRDHIYVSAGLYPGRVDLVEGVSIWGGYSATDGWQRSSEFVVTIGGGTLSGDLIGIYGTNLAEPVVLADLDVVTGTAPDGGHNYGVLLRYSQGVTLERVRVLAGPGGTGVPGAQGAKGTDGSRGGDASEYENGGGGAGAHAGGAGGHGGTAWGGWDGDEGAGPDHSGGNGGPGGGWGTNGTSGSSGVNGGTGSAGGIRANAGGIVGGLWSQGGTGHTGGTGGKGTGGGGGGGGGVIPFSWGGGGGGGGGGGWGGAGGIGGGEGGSSFGLFLVGTDVVLHTCELTSGQGGVGGTGGPGGERGRRGIGGTRGINGSAPVGGYGGEGGYGGTGGAGGGGGGGHSYALVADLATSYQVFTSLLLNISDPGVGGSGGNTGLPGQSAFLREF